MLVISTCKNDIAILVTCNITLTYITVDSEKIEVEMMKYYYKVSDYLGLLCYVDYCCGTYIYGHEVLDQLYYLACIIAHLETAEDLFHY